MKAKKADLSPFWVDYYGYSKPYEWTKKSRFAIGRWGFYRIITLALLIIAAISLSKSEGFSFLWCMVGFYIRIYGSVSFGLYRNNKRSKEAKEIQQRARQQTNSTHIGSACTCRNRTRYGNR